MLCAEYDYDMDIAVQKEESYEDGFETGFADGERRGKIEGSIEGERRGKAESIIELLKFIGEVPEELKEKIIAQTNMEVLNNWLRFAATVSSVNEFECKIKEYK